LTTALIQAIPLAWAVAVVTADDVEPPPPTEAQRWRFFQDEQQINALLLELVHTHVPNPFAINNVACVETAPPRLIPNQTVIVRDGRIGEVGPAGTLVVPPEVRQLDGRGKFLLPGLVDAHVHTLVTNAHHLLNLVNGVTTVREMCGFPWMLEFRQRVRENRILAPNIYVTGTILNGAPMGMYAVVVKDPGHGRALVREHHVAGYDFIKVHNVMKPAVYEAVLDEARKLGIDVVGHIPHEITLEQAIKQGHRTFEHFKGYYLDRSLEMSTEDYVRLTRGADIWNCPTFYTHRIGLRGDDVRALLAREEGQYVPPYERAQWLSIADGGGGENHRKVYDLSKRIFRDLLAADARFLAGTDSGGGYPMMVPGFALHEELRCIVANGLSIPEAIRSATANPAAAMRRQGEFGSIAPGLRADLLLTSRNPLESIENLAAIEGVAVRGIWLDRTTIESIKIAIRVIYEESQPRGQLPSADQMNQLAESVLRLHGQGFVFMDHYLNELAALLRKNGQSPEAVLALRTTQRP
jgi:imidazolonepropionase-like amidohydrolase